MPSLTRPAVCCALLLACGGVLPARAACPRTDLPAATLLFPYFEVDLAGSLTTLLSINAKTFFGNSPGVLARVTLWTNWAIPTASFDLYLRQGDVQTINLRDIFTSGAAPTTFPPAGVFSGCPSQLGGALAPAEELRAKHTGHAVGNLCFGKLREPTIAEGYVTVDVVTRCSAPSMNPTVRSYFRGSSPVAATASSANLLWGDFMLVDPGNDFASGQNAVQIQAAPPGGGLHTFYGRYVEYSGADKRAPLTNLWAARYMIGPPFDDTTLVVWRDTRNAIPAPVNCANKPAWFPLTQHTVRARNEAGTTQPAELIPQNVFPLATQVALVTLWDGAVTVEHPTRIVPTSTFGLLELNLDFADERHSQGWVGWLAKAENRFSAGLAATPMTEACNRTP